VVISFSSVLEGLHPFHERVRTNTTDPANFLDSSAGPGLDIVNRMWWRTLGVAVVLLCVGVAGGYAVADRSQVEPARSDTLQPVPAVSPAVPTPPVHVVLPDPDDPALLPDLPSHETELRVSRRGIGVSVLVPDGWVERREEGSNTWNYAVAEAPKNTYVLRIRIVAGDHVSIAVAKQARISALEDAMANKALLDLTISADTEDTFEASYLDHGYQRLTMERWVSFNGSTAYAEAAVTGRVRDEEGMRDLLVRTLTSMQELQAVPKGEQP
jgi:hypothetical protein